MGGSADWAQSRPGSHSPSGPQWRTGGSSDAWRHGESATPVAIGALHPRHVLLPRKPMGGAGRGGYAHAHYPKGPSSHKPFHVSACAARTL